MVANFCEFEAWRKGLFINSEAAPSLALPMILYLIIRKAILADISGIKVFDNSPAPAYIYRWGGITGHNSCYARDLKTCMKRFHQDVVNDKRFKRGKLLIQPAWSENFEKLAGNFCG